MIVDHQIETGLLKPDLKDKVTYTLLRKHRHQTKKSNLRSLADIGKTVSSASRMFTNPDNGNAGADWLLLSLPAPLTFTPSCHLFLKPPLHIFFLKFTCHSHFIMTLSIPLGRLAVMLERFQLLSYRLQMPRCLACSIYICSDGLRWFGNNAVV